MQKILFSVLFLVACVLAEDFNRPSVYEPETQYHIYTKILEPNPRVQNGFWKSKCKIRIEFEKGLLNLGQCGMLDSASGFLLYDKEKFVIGSFLPLDNSLKIQGGEANFQMKLTLAKTNHYTFGIEDIHDIEFIDPSWKINFRYIGCNEENAMIYENPLRCLVEYKCTAGYYASDKTNCEPLPAHATRHETTGFSCDMGYRLNAKNTGRSFENLQCVKDNEPCLGILHLNDEFKEWLCLE